MGNVRSFRDLLAYQSARTLARLVRDHTRGFPADERYGLTNQVRRAALDLAVEMDFPDANQEPIDALVKTGKLLQGLIRRLEQKPA